MVLPDKNPAKLRLMIRKTLLAVRKSKNLLHRTDDLVQQPQPIAPVRIKRARFYSNFYVDQSLLELQKLWPRL